MGNYWIDRSRSNAFMQKGAAFTKKQFQNLCWSYSLLSKYIGSCKFYLKDHECQTDDALTSWSYSVCHIPCLKQFNKSVFPSFYSILGVENVLFISIFKVHDQESQSWFVHLLYVSVGHDSTVSVQALVWFTAELCMQTSLAADNLWAVGMSVGVWSWRFSRWCEAFFTFPGSSDLWK